MLKNVFCCFAVFFFALLHLSAGELEDFETSVEYLKNMRSLKQQNNNQQFMMEFQKQTVQALASSFRIQQSVEKLGIRKTSLDTTLRKMIRAIDSFSVGDAKTNAAETDFNRAYNELRQQIRYLKEINYSFEKGTCDAPSPELNSYDALYHFQNLVTNAYRAFVKKQTQISKQRLEEYKHLFNDIRKVETAIRTKVLDEKIKLPSRTNMQGHTNTFLKTCEALADLRSNRKNYTKRSRQWVLKDQTAFREVQEMLDFSARQLKNDLDTFHSMHFRLRIDKVTLEPYTRQISPRGDTPAAAPAEKKKASPVRTTKKSYAEALRKAYSAEDRTNGVSEKYYRDFRALLPPAQQQMLDKNYRAQLARELPPAHARRLAVAFLYTQYQLGKWSN